jgi:hypothetical protein
MKGKAKMNKSITVTQLEKRATASDPKEKFHYHVESLVNTTEPRIGEYISEDAVTDLMVRGINVKIVAQKR